MVTGGECYLIRQRVPTPYGCASTASGSANNGCQVLSFSAEPQYHTNDLRFLPGCWPESEFIEQLAHGRTELLIGYLSSFRIRCTTCGPCPVPCLNPNLLNILRIAVFSGRTSAISSLRTALRAITAR
jgi:hypothetical protein